jgi:hypothetical protein
MDFALRDGHEPLEDRSYGVTTNSLPQVHGLSAWSPPGGAILGGGGNFRRWGLS